MSTHIAPRPRSLPQPASRARSGPTHSRPTSSAPFRWTSQRSLSQAYRPRVACLPDIARTQAELPDPSAWAATLARAIVEVVTGARQAPHLHGSPTPELYTALTDIHLSPCARGASAIHVRVCSIDARHTEAAVIVATASRIYALALRLEEYRGRWMATALELA